MKNKGFTLVEVVVVVVVLSILATMLIPKMTGFFTKGTDEKNHEDAQNILDCAQAEFYKLYAINSHDDMNKKSVIHPKTSQGKDRYFYTSAVKGENGASTWTDVYSTDKLNLRVASINHKKNFPLTLDILTNVGYKVNLEGGQWISDVPCWVMVITGDYSTYCDPTLPEYNPEKAYTVYGVIFLKNYRSDFFVLLKDGTIYYPRNPNELDKIIDSIKDENDKESDDLIKEIYILKSGVSDDHPESMWNNFHLKSNVQIYEPSYISNRRSRYDDYRFTE